jgi:hypothetical protein
MTATTSRRAILAGAAALATTAPAIATLASTPDPVFAAIEEYRSVLDSIDVRRVRFNKLETEIIERSVAAAKPRMASRIQFEKANPDYKFAQTQEQLLHIFILEERARIEKETPFGAEFLEAEADWNDAEYDSVCDLLETVPTTTTGALAFIAALKLDFHPASIELTDMSDDDGTPLLEVALNTIE